jgi:hypothetical protein
MFLLISLFLFFFVIKLLQYVFMEILANGQRSDVPTSVTRDASSIDTSSLGTPDAEYLSSGCDIDTAFTGMCPFSLPSIRVHGCDEKGEELMNSPELGNWYHTMWGLGGCG